MSFGSNLLAWRRSRHLTQTALASRAGLPQPNIAAFEAGRGEPKLSTIERLACALEITAGTLLDQQPQKSTWDRPRIDALIKGAIAPDLEKKSTRSWREHALRIALSPKLAAAGRPISMRGRTGVRLQKQLKADLGPEIWDALVRRLEKHFFALGADQKKQNS